MTETCVVTVSQCLYWYFVLRFQTDEQRLEWRVHDQSEKNKQISKQNCFIKYSHIYIKIHRFIFFLKFLFVCNTTIKPMPEDKQNQWWKIISAHTVCLVAHLPFPYGWSWQYMSHTSPGLNTELDTSHFVGSTHMILNKTCGSFNKNLQFLFSWHPSAFILSPLQSGDDQRLKCPKHRPFFLWGAVHLSVDRTCWQVSESVVPSCWGNRSLGLRLSYMKQSSWGCLPVSLLPRSRRSGLCRMEAHWDRCLPPPGPDREKLQGDLAEWGWNKCLDMVFKLQMIITCLWTYFMAVLQHQKTVF